MAPSLYTPEGKDISDGLRKETMDEFSFVKPEELLQIISQYLGRLESQYI